MQMAAAGLFGPNAYQQLLFQQSLAAQSGQQQQQQQQMIQQLTQQRMAAAMQGQPTQSPPPAHPQSAGLLGPKGPGIMGAPPCPPPTVTAPGAAANVPSNLLGMLGPHSGTCAANAALNNNSTPVIMVYNLVPSEASVIKLFNVFSLFGPVDRIKLLRDKPGCAMIQYSHPIHAILAATYLNDAPLFGQHINISFSKCTEVKIPNVPYGQEAEDAAQRRTQCFEIKQQRYPANEVDKYLNMATKPTNSIFVANIHENVSEDGLTALFSAMGSLESVGFKTPRPGTKKKMAVIKYSSVNEAVGAIAALHNHELNGVQLKIAFSLSGPAGPPPPRRV
eukprot:Selendium_serpulae@DN4390_c0_g1_i1.p1